MKSCRQRHTNRSGDLHHKALKPRDKSTEQTTTMSAQELQQPQMHWLLQCGQSTQHTTADQRKGKDVDTVWDPTTSMAVRCFSFINPSNPQKTLSWALSLFHRENEDLSVSVTKKLQFYKLETDPMSSRLTGQGQHTDQSNWFCLQAWLVTAKWQPTDPLVMGS